MFSDASPQSLTSGSSQLKGGRQAHKQAIMRCPGDTVTEPHAGQHGAPRREGLARLGEGLGLGGSSAGGEA